MKYFTADPHIYHEKAVNFPDRKGFTVNSWAEMFFSLVNSKVTKSDRLFILGDFALGAFKYFNKARLKLKPKDIWLIEGNHDPSITACKRTFGDKFRQVYDCKIRDKQCWLSHYPHLVWPASHYGSFHLHGHLHDQRTDFWDEIPYLKDRRSLDVCPESYKRIFGEWGIFSEDQIYDILIARPGNDDVSWYREQRGEL